MSVRSQTSPGLLARILAGVGLAHLDQDSGRYVLGRSIENPAIPLTAANIAAYLGGGQASAAGIYVSEATAMNFATVATCVRILSQAVAALPLRLMRRVNPRRTEKAREHPLYALVARAPNDLMTSYTWRQTQQGHVLLEGNSYSRIEFAARSGRAARLMPLLPDRTQVRNVRGRLVYDARESDDTGTQRELRLDQDEVLHVPGLSFDGVRGYAPVTLMRETIAQGVLGRDFASRTYASGGMRGWIEHPGTFKDEQAAQAFRVAWDANYAGPHNVGKVAVLQKGLKYHNLDSMPLADAELLANRKFTAREIAGWFGVPPYMLGDMEQAKFTNMEQGDLYVAKHVLAPWLIAWEQELDRKLLLDREREEYFFQFNMDGLLRGDTKARAEAIQIYVNTGVYSINDARELLDLPADDADLDEHRVPLNTGKAGEEPAPKPAPAATPPAEDDDERKLAPFAVLVRDACERIAAKEAKALGRMATRAQEGEAFVEEAAAFLRGHGAYVRAQLGGVFAAMATVAGGWRCQLEDVSAGHVRAVRDALAQALNDGGLDGARTWLAAHADAAGATLADEVIEAWKRKA